MLNSNMKLSGRALDKKKPEKVIENFPTFLQVSQNKKHFFKSIKEEKKSPRDSFCTTEKSSDSDVNFSKRKKVTVDSVETSSAEGFSEDSRSQEGEIDEKSSSR